MSDLKGNVKNNSTYLTTKDSTSTSRMNKLKQTRNSNKISTSSDSLITFDENGNVDMIQALMGNDCLGTYFNNGIAKLYFYSG